MNYILSFIKNHFLNSVVDLELYISNFKLMKKFTRLLDKCKKFFLKQVDWQQEKNNFLIPLDTPI